MNYQSGSISYQALCESALRAYEGKTGIALVEHPLATKLQNSRSVEHITTLLQDEMPVSSDFRGNDIIIRTIKGITSTLSTLSITAALGWAVGMVSHRHSCRVSTSMTPSPAVTLTGKCNIRWSRCPACCVSRLSLPTWATL